MSKIPYIHDEVVGLLKKLLIYKVYLKQILQYIIAQIIELNLSLELTKKNNLPLDFVHIHTKYIYYHHKRNLTPNQFIDNPKQKVSTIPNDKFVKNSKSHRSPVSAREKKS